jgi:molybdate transport system regulatory protein
MRDEKGNLLIAIAVRYSAWFLVCLIRVNAINRQMYRPFKITSELEIAKNGACFLNSRRVKLLKLIRERGSILSASKELGMSYQQAWMVIRDVNEGAPLPVVIRQRGGANGGGAMLTGFGVKMVEHFDKIQEKYNRFKAALEADVDSLCAF